MMVQQYLLVSNFHSEMSTVKTRSRSAFRLSRTHAYLKSLPKPSRFFLELLNRRIVNAAALVYWFS